MVVAVAEESRGAEHARPWIEQAKSELLAADRHRSSAERSLQPRERAAGRLDRRAGPHRAAARDRGLDRPLPPHGSQDPHHVARGPGGAARRPPVLSRCGARLGEYRQTCPAGRRRPRRAAQGDQGDRRGACPIQTGRMAARPWRHRRRRSADEHSECTSSRTPGACGARPPISTRSARPRVPTSGNACKRWATGRIIRHPSFRTLGARHSSDASLVTTKRVTGVTRSERGGR